MHVRQIRVSLMGIILIARASYTENTVDYIEEIQSGNGTFYFVHEAKDAVAAVLLHHVPMVKCRATSAEPRRARADDVNAADIIVVTLSRFDMCHRTVPTPRPRNNAYRKVLSPQVKLSGQRLYRSPLMLRWAGPAAFASSSRQRCRWWNPS
jgi:hypothetical protein